MSNQEEPSMSTAVDTWHDPTEITDSQLESIHKQAAVYAKSKLVPTAFQNKPDDIAVVFLTARGLGIPLTASVLKKFYVVNGGAEPMAQIVLGLAYSHGHDIWQTSQSGDETQATYAGKRRGSDRVREFTFTIEDARRAHLLDSWVEKWIKDDGKWKKEATLVIAVDDVPVGPQADFPEWARKQITQGRVKRNDAWFNWRPDMLCARASVRAVRGTCPEVLLGMPSIAMDDGGHNLSGGPARSSDPSAGPDPAVQRERVDQVVEDDEIVDAEIVDDGEPARGQGDEPGSDTREPAEPDGEASQDAVVDAPPEPDPQPAPDLVDDVWRRDFAIACTNIGLSDDQRHELLSLGTRGRIRSSKQLRKREVADVSRWLRRYLDGEYAFVKLPDGNEALVPRSSEGGAQLPLEESA